MFSDKNLSFYLSKYHIYIKIVDETFGGNLNVFVHNASQIHIPEGYDGNPYDLGQPSGKFGSLLETGKSCFVFLNNTLCD